MKEIMMQTKYLKKLHDLQYQDDMSAEQLRLAIEIIFRKDYFQTQIAGKSKTKDEFVNECLLHDDLEERIGYYESLGNKDLYQNTTQKN